MLMGVCFVDLDGVLVDFVGGLAKALGSALTRHTWPDTYCLELALGLDSPEAVWQHPNVETKDFWANLEKLQWADDLVKLAGKRRREVVFLSQGVRDPQSYGGKVMWVKQHYPKIPYLLGSQKKFVAAPGHILIDDHLDNIDAWAVRGGTAVLVPAPWNEFRGMADDLVVSSVTDWLEEVEGLDGK